MPSVFDSHDLKALKASAAAIAEAIAGKSKGQNARAALAAVTTMHEGVPMLPEVIIEQASEYLEWLNQHS